MSQGRKEAAGPRCCAPNPGSVTARVALARCSTALCLLQRDNHTPHMGMEECIRSFRQRGQGRRVLCVCMAAVFANLKMLESDDVTTSVAVADPVLRL